MASLGLRLRCNSFWRPFFALGATLDVFLFSAPHISSFFFCGRFPSGVTLDFFFLLQPRTHRLFLRLFPLRRDSRFFFSPARTFRILCCDSSAPPACLSIFFFSYTSRRFRRPACASGVTREFFFSRPFFAPGGTPDFSCRPRASRSFFFFAAVRHLRRDSQIFFFPSSRSLRLGRRFSNPRVTLDAMA